MSSEIQASAQDLRNLVESLDPKQMMRAMKNSLRKEARAVAKPAIQSLKSYVLSNGKKVHNVNILARGIRANVRQDMQGYIVSVAFKSRSYGFYEKGVNGKYGKPVLYWLNNGTGPRRSAGKAKDKVQRNRGMMPKIGFMAASVPAREQSVQRLMRELESQCIRQIEKYGKRS